MRDDIDKRVDSGGPGASGSDDFVKENMEAFDDMDCRPDRGKSPIIYVPGCVKEAEAVG